MSDRIEAHLREAAPMPVGTGTLAKVVGKVPRRWPCVCPRCHDAHVEVTYYPARSHDIISLLRRLERLGHVERIVIGHGPGNGSGQFYWRWLGAE